MPRSPSTLRFVIVLPIGDEDDGTGVPAYGRIRDVALAAEARLDPAVRGPRSRAPRDAVRSAGR
jgi:hypothetical protein